MCVNITKLDVNRKNVLVQKIVRLLRENARNGTSGKTSSHSTHDSAVQITRGSIKANETIATPIDGASFGTGIVEAGGCRQLRGMYE